MQDAGSCEVYLERHGVVRSSHPRWCLCRTSDIRIANDRRQEFCEAMQRFGQFGIQHVATDSEMYDMQSSKQCMRHVTSQAAPDLSCAFRWGVCSARTMRSWTKSISHRVPVVDQLRLRRLGAHLSRAA
jgi:hypothetical protein